MTSTRSPFWCTVVIIALALVFAWGVGFNAKRDGDSFAAAVAAGSTDAVPPTPLTAYVATVGLSGIGVLVLMVLGALAITSEYRFGIIRTTFQAMPNRAVVLIVKAALTGLFGAVLSFALAFVAFFITKASAGDAIGSSLVLEGSETWRTMYGIPIFAFLCVLLAVGVGTLVRQSAGAISLLLLWPLAVETLIPVFGGFGRAVQPFLPFGNAYRFLGGGDSGTDFHWGPWASLAYFAAWVVVIFGAAVVVVNRRDA